MGKRVDWTTFEQAQVYSATVDLLKSRKVPLPVAPPGKDFLQAIRDAQVSLPENRRRPLASIDAVTGDIAKRLVENGIIRADHQESYRRGWDKKQRKAEKGEQEVDPRDARIEDLQVQLHRAEARIEGLESQAEEYRAQIKWLKEQPGPMEVIQKWVAHTLSLALQEAENAKKPAFMDPTRIPTVPREPLPEFEKERRKDPTPRQEEGEDKKPKIAVVAELNTGGELEQMHAALSGIARMRYLKNRTMLDNLKPFVESGGKVVVWTERIPHDFRHKIQSQGIPFKWCNGPSVKAVIDCVKEMLGA